MSTVEKPAIHTPSEALQHPKPTADDGSNLSVKGAHHSKVPTNNIPVHGQDSGRDKIEQELEGLMKQWWTTKNTEDALEHLEDPTPVKQYPVTITVSLPPRYEPVTVVPPDPLINEKEFKRHWRVARSALERVAWGVTSTKEYGRQIQALREKYRSTNKGDDWDALFQRIYHNLDKESTHNLDNGSEIKITRPDTPKTMAWDDFCKIPDSPCTRKNNNTSRKAPYNAPYNPFDPSNPSNNFNNFNNFNSLNP